MKRWIFSLLFLNVVLLHADNIDVTQPLHIHRLIPRRGMFSTLAVEPALPKDFIALGKSGDIDYCDWVYWGPEKTLKAYFQDPMSLSEPIIRVKLCANFAQRTIGRLDEELLRNQVLQNSNLAKLSIDFGKWGNYPYCLIWSTEKEKNYTALVGMNDESNGNVLMFHLIIPQKSGTEIPALLFWNNFFKNTKELPEPLLFKAHGQEMHSGYTIVDIVDRKVTVIAEKRKADQKLQCAVIPQDENVEFKVEKAFTGLMKANWHHDEPVLKISGQYVVDGSTNLFTTTSILIKEVEEFTSIPPKKNAFILKLE